VAPHRGEAGLIRIRYIAFQHGIRGDVFETDALGEHILGAKWRVRVDVMQIAAGGSSYFFKAESVVVDVFGFVLIFDQIEKFLRVGPSGVPWGSSRMWFF